MSTENASVAITNEAIQKMDDLIDTCERGRDILNHVATTVRSAKLQLSGEKKVRTSPQGSANIRAAARKQWVWCREHGHKHRKSDWAKFHPEQGKKLFAMKKPVKKAA